MLTVQRRVQLRDADQLRRFSSTVFPCIFTQQIPARTIDTYSITHVSTDTTATTTATATTAATTAATTTTTTTAAAAATKPTTTTTTIATTTTAAAATGCHE